MADAAAGKKPFKLDLGVVGAVVAFPVICWAFYTTSSGMIDIMRKGPDDLIGPIGAFIGSAAILATLALTSWILGADLASLMTKRTETRGGSVARTIAVACIFLFVFSMSAFFSFTYYYNNIFNLSSRKTAGENQPMELARTILPPLMKAVQSNYDSKTAQIVEGLNASSYFASLDALIKAAGNGGQNFRDGLIRIQQEQRRTAEEQAKEYAERLKAAQDAKRELDARTPTLDKLKKDIANIDELIKPKQEQVDELNKKAAEEDSLAVDADHGLDGKKAICGPNCMGHKAKASEARRTKATIQDTITRLDRQKSDFVKRRDDLTREMDALRQKADAPPAPPPALALDANLQPVEFNAVLRELSEVRDRVRNDPSWPNVKAAKASCSAILTAARQANIRLDGVAAGFDCEPGDVVSRDLLTARDAVLVGRAEFNTQCALGGAISASMEKIAAEIRIAPPKSSTSAASEGLGKAKSEIDECVSKARNAGLPYADVQDFLKRSSDFLAQKTLDRDRFQLANEAFWSGTPVASLAIGVAVAQDAFILILKLLADVFSYEARPRPRVSTRGQIEVSDRETDSPDIRARKALVREARARSGQESEINQHAEAIERLPLEVQQNLMWLLNSFVRTRTAKSRPNGLFIVDNARIEEVEAELVGQAAPAKANAVRRDIKKESVEAPPVRGTEEAEEEAANQSSDDQSPKSNSRRRRNSSFDRRFLLKQGEPVGDDFEPTSHSPDEGNESEQDPFSLKNLNRH